MSISFSKATSMARGTRSRVFGNRSSSRPMKILVSSLVSLPRLKSRRARRSTLSSVSSGAARFIPPATYSVVLIARSFQS